MPTEHPGLHAHAWMTKRSGEPSNDRTDQQHGQASRWLPAHRGLRACLWLGVLLLVLGFAFQGTRGLWNTDEGRYVDNALQMVDSGNYLVPAYNADHLNFSKPPLVLWAIAASVRVMGKTTWAVRTPSALAFVLTALLLCGMGRVLVPERPWLPGLIYGCSLAPFIAANVVSTDDLLALCEALAMWGFLRAGFGAAGERRGFALHVMWLGFGLAFLTKGPPGLLPLLAIVVFIARRDGMKALRGYFPWSGMLLFGVLGFAWYAVVILRTPGLFDYFMKYEVFDRVFTSVQGRNPQWYGWLVAYGPVFVLGTLPWWPALMPELKAAVLPASWRGWWREPSLPLFLGLWLALPLLVFCIARSRLPVYALPLFIPVSLMVALALRSRLDLASWRQRVALGLWVAALLAFKGGVALHAHPLSDDRVFARQLSALTGNADYSAVAFVEATDSSVSMEEHTPWGMRLYLDKPIYALSWSPQGARLAQEVCRLSVRHPSLLLVVDDASSEALTSDLTALSARFPGVSSARLGSWRRSNVVLLRRRNAPAAASACVPQPEVRS